MDSFKKARYKSAALTLKNALISRGFDAYVCENGEEATTLALSLIPENHSVGFGGSVTLDSIGIKEALYEKGQEMIDRSKAKSTFESREIMKKALLADTFLMGTNAVSADGQLVNIDGNGNRVAALCYGPSQVLVFAGMNKLAPDLDSALKRARNSAAPTNAARFDITTPCKSQGVCRDCKNPDSICAQIVITRMCREKGRIKVILITEELGF